jgi:hypothetical protein
MKLLKRLTAKRDPEDREKKERELKQRQRDGENRLKMLEAQARVLRRG